MSEIFITKTAAQARVEQAKHLGEASCPECGTLAIGFIQTRIGLFKTEQKKSYSCYNCGCRWETGWTRE